MLGEKYDLAVAGYLSNYARDRHELADMCNSIACSLKSDGRFVTANWALDFRKAPSYRKYGFETSVGDPLREGTPITWTVFLEDKIENYFLDVAIHEEEFRSAGIRKIRWHKPRLSPDGDAAFGPEFWASFLEHSPITFIECLK